jgi:hypothetical protein
MVLCEKETEGDDAVAAAAINARLAIRTSGAHSGVWQCDPWQHEGKFSRHCTLPCVASPCIYCTMLGDVWRLMTRHDALSAYTNLSVASSTLL